MQQKYEVIRLIKQNAGCHVVTDYVQGEILVFYLRNHPQIKKEELLSFLRQIIRQLDNIQHVRGMNGYGCVTPYCIVVGKDKNIAFLDLRAESNASVVRKMGQPAVRRLFFPEEESEDDFYPLGKTIQFLFAHTKMQPELTKRETYRFQKIISKCLKEHSRKSYQNISDILKEFPKRKEKREKNTSDCCLDSCGSGSHAYSNGRKDKKSR